MMFHGLPSDLPAYSVQSRIKPHFLTFRFLKPRPKSRQLFKVSFVPFIPTLQRGGNGANDTFRWPANRLEDPLAEEGKLSAPRNRPETNMRIEPAKIGIEL